MNQEKMMVTRDLKTVAFPLRRRRGGGPANLAGALIPVAAAGLLFLTSCTGNQEALPAAGKNVQCATAVVESRVIPLTVPATGNLEAEQTVNISTRMMGWVREIHVNEGDVVKTGDRLVSIDDSDVLAKRAQTEAAIVEAEAVLDNAEKMTERFQKLYADKSVSKQQLDDVLTGRDRAAAGLRAARAMREEVDVHLSYLEITAPFSGIVARKMIEVGDMANPGMPLLILQKSDRMKVVARLGEKHINSVQLGDVVTVDVTSLTAATFAVPIAEIILTANPGSRTYDIEAYVDNPDGRLKSGMFARVEVTVGERTGLVVPRGSIVERGQLRGIHIVDENQTVHLRWIRLGQDMPEGIEVLSGLDGGETIVVSAAEPLVEGDKVVR